MDDFDSTWCPVCSRQIVPKRIPAPVAPLPSNAPPASAAPQPIPSNDTSARLARGKAGGTIRPRPQGLVHGTGRVRPNGAIKRSPPLDAPQDTKTTLPSKPVTPVRRRTVIDQTPAPLYCSDECRLADLQSIHGAIDIKYQPDRCSSPNLPPVPPNSVSDYQSSQEDSDSSSGASYDSRSSISSPTTTTPTLVPAPATTKSDIHVDAYSRLAAFYGFDPLPPPPPYTRKSNKSAAPEAPPPMEGGAMMAARRIQAALCPEKPKKSPWGVPLHNDKDDNKPIPGWTDGSNAWRASVYGFAPPRDFTRKDPRTDPDDAAIRAYGSYVASPHRSRGVHSTLGEGIAAADASLNASTASLPSRVVDASTEHLYRQYSASFTQRSKSRISSRNGLSTSPTRSLVKPGAEGRLLVPDVKMRRVNSSLSSIDGSSGASWDSQSAIISMSSVTSRKRSPLSRQNSDASVDTTETPSEEDELDAARVAVSSLTSDKARPSSTHTWSYSLETLMYPIMRVAPKEKRIVRKVIDGVEQDVEVFVEERPKRLFLFGGALD